MLKRYNRRLNRKLVICLIFITFIISGCWDRREIENHGFILGIAVDFVKSPEPKGSYDIPKTTQAAGRRKYLVTYELPKFKKKMGEQNGNSAEEHLIFTGEGESMFAIARSIAAKTYFKLFVEDIQMLVFSEDVARDGIGGIIDFYLRDPEMRRRVKLFVSKGRAEDILKAKLQVEEVNSVFISKITRNVGSMPMFASKTDLGDISEAMRNKRSFFVPIVIVEEGNVRLTKAALFNREKKMVGELNEIEVVGAKILRKVLKQGITVVPHPCDSEKVVAFELYEPTIKVNAVIDDIGQLKFSVNAKFVGNLGEKMACGDNALDPEFLKAVEKELEEEFTREVYETYKKQQELRVDISDLGDLVYREHPQYWKKVKDRWDDEVFPTVPLDVNIKVIVRRTAMTR